MNIRDFEPVNGGLLSSNKLNLNNYNRVNYRVNTRKRIVKQEPIMKISNDTHNIDGEAKYPIEDEKKIFGMRPKTLAISLSVIVISILIMNTFGSKQAEVSHAPMV